VLIIKEPALSEITPSSDIISKDMSVIRNRIDAKGENMYPRITSSLTPACTQHSRHVTKGGSSFNQVHWVCGMDGMLSAHRCVPICTHYHSKDYIFLFSKN